MEKKKIVMYSVIPIIAIIIVITLFSSFKTVKSGEIGLKVRFGKITNTSLGEGINFKFPFVEKIEKVNIKIQKVEVSGESSTKDMQIVNASVSVNYRIDSKQAVRLYKNVGNKYEDTILKPAIKESIKSAIAQYNAEEITVNRSVVSQSCLNALQEKVSKYGIVIEDFNLTDFSFSEEYTKAIEEKQVAEQNLEKSRLESEKKLLEAETEKKANELKEQTLTDKIIKEKFVEKWNGELPKVTDGNSIFDIGKIMGE